MWETQDSLVDSMIPQLRQNQIGRQQDRMDRVVFRRPKTSLPSGRPERSLYTKQSKICGTVQVENGRSTSEKEP